MDKRTIIGFVLIGAILLGFSWYNSKQAQKFQAEKAIADSIALAQERLNAPLFDDNEQKPAFETESPLNENRISPDSLRIMQYGLELHQASMGTEELYELENDVMKVTISNKGAKVMGVELKGYGKFDGGPVEMYDTGTAEFDLRFFTKKDYNTIEVNTSAYYFNADIPSHVTVSDEGGYSVSLKLPIDERAYLEYVYTMYKDEYMLGFDVRFVNLNEIDPRMDLVWSGISPLNERGSENGSNFSTIAYKYPNDSKPDNLGMSKAEKSTSVKSKVQWVAFKQRFFSSVFISEENFENAELRYETFALDKGEVKKYEAILGMPYVRGQNEYSFRFYYGPNKFSELNQYDDLELQRLVPIGRNIVRWVNRFIVIPVFDFLGRFISSYGIIILLLTILMKIITFPLTYKSTLSSAKMRAIKPEIDAIAEKYPKKEDAMKKSQATMELYKRMGISPMGGCLPLLVQMPILFALLRFFPASIELRGQSFLWAEDLSSYDSILNLPFNIPFYGDHISLFTLLMAATMHVSSRISLAQQGAAAPQMGGMKFMMLWMMPVMMLLFFNNYSSGLSYYYFLSSLITIGQTYAVRKFVSDDKLRAKMQENASKKPKKKSKWQQRYEEAIRAQQQAAKQQQAKGGKKR